jgi:putative oxidoreductase
MSVPTSLAALVLRLVVGVVFLAAGAEKVLRGPDYAAGYFESLGVIWPTITGPLVSWLELLTGAALIVGLLTVLSAVYLASEMLIVVLFIRLPEAALAPSITDAIVAVRLEATLAAGATAIALIGPGRVSLDALLGDRLRSWRRRSRPPSD